MRWKPRMLPLIAAALAMALCLPLASATRGQEPLKMPQQGISAHRGASSTHPENTIAAIREAVRLGAHQIEIDVAFTRDRQLVLMHDPAVTRTTNARAVFPGRESYDVSSFTLSELKRLDAGSWKHERFAGEPIPTLAEALAALPPNIWVNVHLKGDRALGEAVADEVLRLRREHQAFLSVTAAEAAGARLAAQRAKRRILLNNMQRQGTGAAYVDETIAGQFDFLQFLGGPFPAAADIVRLKDAGVRINYCCTNDPAMVQWWLKQGIDFPLVDDVAAAVKAASEIGIEPLVVPDHLGDCSTARGLGQGGER